MVFFQFFPKSFRIPEHLQELTSVFEINEAKISSSTYKLNSDGVLNVLKKDLEKMGFIVETSKTAKGKINVPVLFGRNGSIEKSFDADAWHKNNRTVLEVEAGRAVTNYQFLKDLFQACMMNEIDYLALAIRFDYRGNPDFEKVVTFFETLYVSGRLSLPLRGVLVIGY